MNISYTKIDYYICHPVARFERQYSIVCRAKPQVLPAKQVDEVACLQV